ncbi:MAG: hypothetical protein MUF70_17560, partial [Myxococcota bacterium]|nr:hypothetical protein [Myxococcota bacterium]
MLDHAPGARAFSRAHLEQQRPRQRIGLVPAERAQPDLGARKRGVRACVGVELLAFEAAQLNLGERQRGARSFDGGARSADARPARCGAGVPRSFGGLDRAEQLGALARLGVFQRGQVIANGRRSGQRFEFRLECGDLGAARSVVYSHFSLHRSPRRGRLEILGHRQRREGVNPHLAVERRAFAAIRPHAIAVAFAAQPS